MYGMCLLVSDSIDRVQLVGQELVLNSANDYNFNLIQKTITNSMWGNELLNKCETLKIYPNPVTSNTVISFYMKSSSDVKLTIHDTNGKNISTLISEKLTSGQHSIVFNAGQLSNGIYYCTLITTAGISVMKMVLIN
jgi:flagellar hook assembly protein FlgD